MAGRYLYLALLILCEITNQSHKEVSPHSCDHAYYQSLKSFGWVWGKQRNLYRSFHEMETGCSCDVQQHRCLKRRNSEILLADLTNLPVSGCVAITPSKAVDALHLSSAWEWKTLLVCLFILRSKNRYSSQVTRNEPSGQIWMLSVCYHELIFTSVRSTNAQHPALSWAL